MICTAHQIRKTGWTSNWNFFNSLTLILLTWRIWWAPNNASRWQMGFNSAFKVLNTGWTQKHSLISSSYKIKSYWNIFYKYGTADTLTQEIFNFPARRQRPVKCKMALTSQQRSSCVVEFHKTNTVVTVQRAFKLKFNVDSFGGTWRTQSMYLHYPQPWMSCRNASLQLSTRSRRICCRESGLS